ncbi:MAG: hypothetical protein A3K46_01105 [Chloroflexi bacterium RBG_13_60_9]|nr:MAG: hypothetical protein A3K46_01105 [Chloroflexi bacterium RBG_13_60_9]
MKSHRRTILPLALVLLVMAFPAFACSVYLGGPELPGPAITPEGDKETIEKSWTDAAALSGDGTVTVVFSEAQMTAYLQQRLEANPGNTFHSAQVFLRDGRIKVYGMLSTGGTSASALLVLRPEVTEQGKINFIMEQAQVGPLDLPAGLLSAVSNVLTEAFTGTVGSLATGFQVKEVLVGEGQIAISGVLR